MTEEQWDSLEVGFWISNRKGRHVRQVLSLCRKRERVAYIEVERLGKGPNVVIDRHYHRNYLLYDKPYILST